MRQGRQGKARRGEARQGKARQQASAARLHHLDDACARRLEVASGNVGRVHRLRPSGSAKTPHYAKLSPKAIPTVAHPVPCPRTPARQHTHRRLPTYLTYRSHTRHRPQRRIKSAQTRRTGGTSAAGGGSCGGGRARGGRAGGRRPEQAGAAPAGGGGGSVRARSRRPPRQSRRASRQSWPRRRTHLP